MFSDLRYKFKVVSCSYDIMVSIAIVQTIVLGPSIKFRGVVADASPVVGNEL